MIKILTIIILSLGINTAFANDRPDAENDKSNFQIGYEIGRKLESMKGSLVFKCYTGGNLYVGPSQGNQVQIGFMNSHDECLRIAQNLTSKVPYFVEKQLEQ